MTYCVDCPDREACHQGMISCELAKRFANAAKLLYPAKDSKGTNPMSNNDKKITAADVLAEAEKKNLLTEVPEQGTDVDEKNIDTTNEEKAETPKVKLVDKAKNFYANHKGGFAFAGLVGLGLVTYVVNKVLAADVDTTEEMEVVEAVLNGDATDDSSEA